jgi:aryl-alcohol dehydrogenase-like predicted oxidoreductase
MARQVVLKTPSLKRTIAKSVAVAPVRGTFSARQAEESLNKSLLELQTDYVDILLLHECMLEDANSPEMLKFLDVARQKGKIRLYGLGTHYRNLPADFHDIADAHSVVQFENNIGKQTISHFCHHDGRLLITHGLFQQCISQNTVYQDVSPVKNALEYAQKSNPDGITLFSSTNIEHIRSNARIWHDIQL